MAKSVSQKLSKRLTLALVIIPFILNLIAAVYAFWLLDDESVRGFVWIVVSSILVYISFQYFFSRHLASRINIIYEKTRTNASHNEALNGHDELHIIQDWIAGARTELLRKTEFANQIKQGQLQSNFYPQDEADVLGHSLVEVRNNLIRIKEEEKKQNWSAEALTKFVDVLRTSSTVKELTNSIIKNLVDQIGANQGAIYIHEIDNSGEEFLELQACYAFKRTKHLTHRVTIGDGLIGQAFLEKEMVYLKEVPDNFVKITSGLGEANPRQVLIVPLKVSSDVIGMIEIASFKQFNKHEIDFVMKIAENIAHSISSIRVAANTKKLLTESQELTEQMRAQEEELKQNQEELQATQEEISRKYKQLFNELKALNYASRFDQLKSITMTKKRSIEYYFDIIRNQIITFSESKMVIDAMMEFKSAFFDLDKLDGSDDLIKKSVEEYYTNEFIPRLSESSDHDILDETYFPAAPISWKLQYHYIANNPHPTGQKSAMDDAGDGSDYSAAHALYHPVIRNFLEKFGYYDIFLIDDETGYMVYSVFKEVDFATSLLTDIYSTTNFGRIVKEAAESTNKDFVKLIDFESYDPSYGAPASFIAKPIYDSGKKIGILVFQMPINKINQVLTGNNNWKEDGLGESGETFIVGSDFKMRSISRELTEDSHKYFLRLKKSGYSDQVIQQVKKTNTNILLERSENNSSRQALGGNQGTQLEKDLLGVEKLNAFAPLEIPNVNWAIVSTMKEEEVSLRINNLQDTGH